MILSNDGLVAFHYRWYGTFFLHKIGSIISIGGFTHYKYYRADNMRFIIDRSISFFTIVDWNKIWTNRLEKSKQCLINVLESMAYYSKFNPL